MSQGASPTSTPTLPPDIDLRPFDPSDDDANKISQGVLVPCRLCLQAFRRVTLTLRYCATCRHAFCEGWHGNFLHTGGRPMGRCVQCGPHVRNAG